MVKHVCNVVIIFESANLCIRLITYWQRCQLASSRAHPRDELNHAWRLNHIAANDEPKHVINTCTNYGKLK